MQPLTTPEATPTRVGPGSLFLCLALALLGSAAVVLPRSLAVEVALPAKACVALLGASIGLALCAQRTRTSDLLPGLRGWILVGLVGLSALRMDAVADPILARERLAGLLALAGSYLLVRRVLSGGAREEQRLESLLAWAGASVALLGLATLAPLQQLLPAVDAGAASFGTRNLAAGFVAVCLPMAWPSAEQRTRALALAPMALYLALAGNRLAALAGASALCALGLRGLWRARALGSWQTWRSGLIFGGLALLVAGALYAAPRPDQRTAVERLHLWDTSMQLALEAPLTGHGPGQWAVEYPRVAALQAEQQFRRFRLLDGPESFVTVRAFRQPAHAHQDLLEIGAELGLPAAAALLGVLLCSLGGLRSRSARRARAAAGVLAALILMQACFPLSEPASACAIGALIALAAPDLRPKAAHPAAARLLSSRALHLGLALACAALAGVGALRLGAEFELASALHAGERQDHRAAIEHAERARALAPAHSRAALYASWSYAASWQTGAALACAERALELRPHSPNAWNDLGLLLRREGRVAEAEAALRHARSLVPGDARVNTNLGALLLTRDSSSEARNCFQRALAENPNVFQAWEGLADCALLEDDLLGALHCMEQAREARLRCQIIGAARQREFDET